MPKNQFQRPLPIRHIGNVPRHGKQQPPASKVSAKPAGKLPAGNLPPLAALLDAQSRK